MLLTLSGLPGPLLTGEDAKAIEALSRVLKTAAAELQLEFSQSGKVDYTYVAGAARAALTEEGAPTDLGLRTGLSLKHILIDEFQDTSIAQHRSPRCPDCRLGARRRTHGVRGGRSGASRSICSARRGSGAIPAGCGAEASAPFRSSLCGSRGISVRRRRSVNWTNKLFAQIFPPEDDVRASAVAFTPSLAARDPRDEPFLTLSLSPGGDRDAEARVIAERIAQIRETSPDASVAILVVSRTHAPPIMSALEAARIEAIGVDLVPLRDISIVRDLVALVKALHHLGDRTAWLAVLRAPWCGVTLPTLTHLSHRKDSMLLWEAMADSARLGQCDPADVARLQRLRGVLEQAIESRDRMELSEWLEAIWLPSWRAGCVCRRRPDSRPRILCRVRQRGGPR